MSFLDPLGDRIKNNYENPFKGFIPKRTNLVLRLDGRAFHTYTRGMLKPFDGTLTEAMCFATQKLAEDIQGCKLAYVQSDEASLWLTDYDEYETQPWFGYDLQKMVSISSSVFTAHFNKKMSDSGISDVGLAMFDARILVIADPVEVANCFIWRSFDAYRNSISSIGQHRFGHKKLHKKSTKDIVEMLKETNDLETIDQSFLYGSFLKKISINRQVGFELENVVIGHEWRKLVIPNHKDIMNTVLGLVPNPHEQK